MRPSSLAVLALAVAIPAGGLAAQQSRIDSLDAFVKAQMAERRIPGLSLAIIHEGRIIARAYGTLDPGGRIPVTTGTLFQAGSISKPVAALGALHLVEAGALVLDGNVNDKLTSWKVPENRFTATEKVTLRRLLSHSAGLTVHGFPGYDVSATVPSVVQVLDGAAPANTRPVRVDTVPGAIWRYSGGGFTVMQQLVVDVTGKPFSRFMQETVLGPIGMTSSSYEQPLPPVLALRTAGGVYGDRTPVRGRWHVYPEMAAAGLWTTPTDLAKFAIEIQETLAGRGHGVISPAMAKQYLTEQKGGYGLGVGVEGSGPTLGFGHGGRDEGFDARLLADAAFGRGVVVMINANDNSRFMQRLPDFISRLWGWPQDSATAAVPTATTAAPIDSARLGKYAGYYEAAENNMVALVPSSSGRGLQTLADGLPDEELLAMDGTRFGSSERTFDIAFVQDVAGSVTGVVLRPGQPRERKAPRVAPLPSSLSPARDPDPELTRRLTAALGAVRTGGASLAQSPDVTPGAKRDFGGGGGGNALDGLGTLTWLGLENVAGRGIRRHGGEVARVVLYQVQMPAGRRYLLIEVTAEGLLTDFDLVDR